MPFGLINARATFQHVTNIVVIREKEKFIVIYLDDMTMYSTYDMDHMKHIRMTFVKCHKYGLSLNPNKSYFSMEEGKLLGHIVSKHDVKIDPERVLAIQKIALPRNKKEVQSFIGKNNFLQNFIYNFADTMKQITNRLCKNHKIQWGLEAHFYFKQIKKAIGEYQELLAQEGVQTQVQGLVHQNTVVAMGSCRMRFLQ